MIPASAPIRPYPYRQALGLLAVGLLGYLVLGGLLALAMNNSRTFRYQLMETGKAISAVSLELDRMHSLSLLVASTGEQVFAARYREAMERFNGGMEKWQRLEYQAGAKVLEDRLLFLINAVIDFQEKAMADAARYDLDAAWTRLRSLRYDDALLRAKKALTRQQAILGAQADAALARQHQYTSLALWCVALFMPLYGLARLVLIRRAKRVYQDNVAAHAEGKEKAQTLAVLLGATSDRVILADETGTILGVNAAAAKGIGLTPEETMGRNLTEVYGFEVGTFRQRQLAKVVASGKMTRFSDQREGVVYDHVVAPLPSHPGAPGRAVIFARDTTDLVRSREAAEAASQAKSEFLANLGHEIRTPLNGILGTAQVLTGLSPTTEQQECLDDITSASQALLVLINDLLELSVIESGRLETVNQPFVLRSLLDGLRADMEPRARAKGLGFVVTVEADVPGLLLGDGAKLGQVLGKLVDNAVKFTAKGRVTVAVTCQVCSDRGKPARAVELTFRVSDTGIGIPERDRERIFERFSQGDGSFTRRFGGAGLGLAIARRLARFLGGDISLESEPGVGSVFSFTLTLRAVGIDPHLGEEAV